LTMESALSMSRRRLSNQPVSMRDRNTLSRFCRAPRASCRRFPTSSGWYLDRNLGRKQGGKDKTVTKGQGQDVGRGPGKAGHSPHTLIPTKGHKSREIRGEGCTRTTQHPKRNQRLGSKKIWGAENQELRALGLGRQ
jgi:hypothetical protein